MSEPTEDGVTVICLEESEWDVFNRARLSDALSSAVDRPRLVIDFSTARYFDSAAISVLLTLYRERFHERGFPPASLVVSAPNVRRTFQMMGVDRLWPLYWTLEEAVAALDSDDSEEPTKGLA